MTFLPFLLNRSKLPICRSEGHTSELQSHLNLVCRLLLEKKMCRRAGISLSGVCVCRRCCVSVCACVCVYRTRCSYRYETYMKKVCKCVRVFFFNDTATTEIYTLSLHDALPI